MPPKIFLASSSPRRSSILSSFNINFSLIPNLLEPEPAINVLNNLRKEVRNLCYLKAKSSQRQYKGLILSADTIVIYKKKILRKPKNLEQARKTLTLLSGQTHQVISGFCVFDTTTKKKTCRTDLTKVTFKPLTQNKIHEYITSHQVLDKAGSYAIQDIQNQFIDKITGSYYTVMGLPIKLLLKVLKNYAIV